MAVECDRDPLVPVTATWIVPAELKVQDSVALPDPVTLVGLTVHEVLLVENPTRPLNPFVPETVTVELATLPVLTVALVGFAVSVKSCTAKATITE